MGDALADEFRGLEDNGQVPLDFAGPAAGEQGDGEGLRVQVMPQQKGPPVGKGRQGFPKGVAHVIHRHALLPVKVGLKGKDDHQAVGEAGEGAHPVGAPGPDLGADVVHHRHPVVSGQAGHPEIEVGKIHQDGQVRARSFQDAADARRACQMAGKWPTTSMRPTTANSEAGVRIRTPWARISSPPTPRNAAWGRTPGWPPPAGGVVVPGGLPGDDEDSGGIYWRRGRWADGPSPLL